jgi:hypothetical protein
MLCNHNNLAIVVSAIAHSRSSSQRNAHDMTSHDRVRTYERTRAYRCWDSAFGTSGPDRVIKLFGEDLVSAMDKVLNGGLQDAPVSWPEISTGSNGLTARYRIYECGRSITTLLAPPAVFRPMTASPNSNFLDGFCKRQLTGYTCPPQIFRSKLLASFMPTNYALAGTAASEYS